MSITHFVVSSSPQRRDFARVSAVEDFALTPAERALFAALDRRGVRFIIVGMGAAVLEGAPIATQDVWFERVDDERIPLAATDAGGSGSLVSACSRLHSGGMAFIESLSS
jgi:hypothetical protein